MTNVEKLEGELKKIREQRDKENRIKHLKKQIRSEKFARTRTGKIFNTIGDFGLKVGKKITAPSKKVKTTKPTKPVKSIKEIIASLPQ